MIVVATSDSDYSSSLVCEWLIYFKKEFIRLNDRVLFSIENFELSEKGFTLIIRLDSGVLINVNLVSSIWYRRGELLLDSTLLDKEAKILSPRIEQSLRLQYEDLNFLVLSLLENRRRINSFFTRRLNKLAVIQLAIEQGLLTPTSYVLSNENQIIDLSDTKLITKSITDSPSIYLDGKQFVLYTNEIDFSKLESGRSFMYSLFQHKIEKKFEIRTFFLNGSFYSMAIFSQGDNKTSLDFRRYNRSFENRKVPFQLPEIIEEKLNGLFNALNLNCGSIDLIFTSNDEYLFLEINPVGQFGMVSFPCNYHLEKIIAEYL